MGSASEMDADTVDQEKWLSGQVDEFSGIFASTGREYVCSALGHAFQLNGTLRSRPKTVFALRGNKPGTGTDHAGTLRRDLRRH